MTPLARVLWFGAGAVVGVAALVGLCVAQHMGWLRRKAGW